MRGFMLTGSQQMPATMYLLTAVELVAFLVVSMAAAKCVLWLLSAGRQVLLQLWATRGMPGPPSYPLLGSFLAVAGPQEELYDRLVALRAEHGPTVKLWLGPVLVVIVSRPDDLEVRNVLGNAGLSAGFY